MTNKSVRVIFDIDVWISFLIGRRLAKIKRHISNFEHKINLTKALELKTIVPFVMG